MSACGAGPEPADGSSPRSAASRVLQVLTALVDTPGPRRIADLTVETGLAKATVYRMLQTLVESGFAVTAPGNTYAVGPRLLGVAAVALAAAPHRPLIRATLEGLGRSTGLSAHFAQRFAGQVVVVDSVESSDPYGLPARTGDTAAVDATAFGLAIDGARPDHAPTLTTSDERHLSGVRSLAAPVFDGDGAVLGAIGVSGTAFHLTDAVLDRLGPLVVDAATHGTAVLSARSTGHARGGGRRDRA